MEKEYIINTDYGMVEVLAEYKEVDNSFDTPFGREIRYDIALVAIRCWLNGYEYTPTDTDLIYELRAITLYK